MDFLDARAPAAAQCRLDLVVGQARFVCNVLEQLAIMDEDLWLAFDEGFQFFVAPGGDGDEIVQQDQGGGGD